VSAAADVDVLLLAPRMLGEEVRTRFLDGRGFFSYVSVEQDASGTAEARLLALALACGTLARGAMRLSATQEARLDLLIEQTVGPYLGTAIQLAFDTGVAHGLPPEALVLEMYMSGGVSRPPCPRPQGDGPHIRRASPPDRQRRLRRPASGREGRRLPYAGDHPGD